MFSFALFCVFTCALCSKCGDFTFKSTLSSPLQHPWSQETALQGLTEDEQQNDERQLVTNLSRFINV